MLHENVTVFVFFCNGGSREVTEMESCLGGLKVKPLVVTPTLTGLLTP